MTSQYFVGRQFVEAHFAWSEPRQWPMTINWAAELDQRGGPFERHFVPVTTVTPEPGTLALLGGGLGMLGLVGWRRRRA